jgi:hypothetical protein
MTESERFPLERDAVLLVELLRGQRLVDAASAAGR